MGLILMKGKLQLVSRLGVVWKEVDVEFVELNDLNKPAKLLEVEKNEMNDKWKRADIDDFLYIDYEGINFVKVQIWLENNFL